MMEGALYKAAIGYRAVEDYLQQKIPPIYGSDQEYIKDEELGPHGRQYRYTRDFCAGTFADLV